MVMIGLAWGTGWGTHDVGGGEMHVQVLVCFGALATFIPGSCRFHGAHHSHGESGRPKPPKEAPTCEPEQPAPTCNWAALGEGLAGAHVTAVAFDPQTAGRAYVSSTGFHISDDDGASFGAPVDAKHGVGPLAFTSREGVFYAATADGIAKTEDGGASWERTGLSGLGIDSLVVDGQSDQHVYATGGTTGVLSSVDGGRRFQAENQGLTPATTRALVAFPSGPGRLLAGLEEPGDAPGLYRGSVFVSNDAGKHWQQTLSGDVVRAIASCPAQREVLWMAQGKAGLFMSTDAGQTWEHKGGVGDTTAVAVRGDDCERIYFAAWGDGFYRSLDGGGSWDGPMATGITLNKLTPQGLAVSHDGQDTILLGTQGGLFRSTDRGDSFEQVEGLSGPSIRGLDRNAAPDGPVFMHTWGSGLWQLRDDQWSLVAGFPSDRGQMVVTSPHDPQHIIAGDYHSHDGGLTWTLPVGQVDTFVAAFHPDDPSIIVLGSPTGGFYRSFDGGQSFEQQNGNLTPWPTSDGTFVDIRDAAFHAGRLYVATNGRGVYVTDNYGDSFTQAAPALANEHVVRLASNGTELVALVSGLGPYVFDGSGWSVQTEGLVTLDVKDAVWDADAGLWYLGTAAGLFQSNGLQAWSLVEQGCTLSITKLVLQGSGPGRRLLVTTKSEPYAIPL